jgi:hypothetical protein
MRWLDQIDMELPQHSSSFPFAAAIGAKASRIMAQEPRSANNAAMLREGLRTKLNKIA